MSHVLTNTSLFKRGKFLYSPQAHNYVIMVDMLRAYYGIQHKETLIVYGFHVILQDQAIKGLCGFMGRSLLM